MVTNLHITFRKKIHHDMIKFQRRGGAKILPNYVRILNEDDREELSWKSQFENSFSRKSNVLRYTKYAEVDFELTTENRIENKR